MKKIYTYILLMACAMMFASCQKEFDGIFEAVIENYSGNNGKVHLNGENYACWDNGDRIQGIVNANEVVANVNISEENPNIAKLNFTLNNVNYVFENGDKFTAIYPRNNYNYTINEVRFNEDCILINKSNNLQILQAPMVATTTIANGCKLRFYNLAALIKMHITNNSGTPISLSRIELTSLTDGVFLEGVQSFTQVDGQAPELGTFTPYNYDGATPSTLTVFCLDQNLNSIEIPSNNTRDFYIYVPANQTCQYQVDVYNTNNEVLFSNKTASKVTISRSHIATMPITLGETPSTPQGTGELDDPYQITSVNQLISLMQGEGLNKCYKLMKSITLPINFAGFGTDASFTGTFDGNGKTITHTSTGGIFNSVDGATIKNLKANVTISNCNSNTGGLINTVYSDPTTIENCIVTGSITAAEYQSVIGGFIGQCHGETILKKCINDADITAYYTIGGLVARLYEPIAITDCTNKGHLIATGDGTVGGLISDISIYSEGSSIIQNSYVLGTIESKAPVGGIIAICKGNQTNTINNVYVDANFIVPDGHTHYAIVGNNTSTGVIFNCTNVFVPSRFIHRNETGRVINKDLYGGYQPGGDLKDNVEAIPNNLLERLQRGQNSHADWSVWVSPSTVGNGTNQPGLDFEGTVGQPQTNQ